jgi:hypothetical protein
VPRNAHNLVLAYQCHDEAHREEKERFWIDFGDVVAYSVVWGAVGTVVLALLGSAVLWGLLLASAAR